MESLSLGLSDTGWKCRLNGDHRPDAMTFSVRMSEIDQDSRVFQCEADSTSGDLMLITAKNLTVIFMELKTRDCHYFEALPIPLPQHQMDEARIN